MRFTVGDSNLATDHRLRKRVTTLRTADVLVEVLRRAGVKMVFGIPGGAIVALNDALLDQDDIRSVTTRHEGGAMFAACGYARATGQVAVVMVTSGPGVLNCVTGLASAFCDGLPVVLIAGEVPRTVFGRGALQEGSANHLNVVGMAKHVTKLAVEATDPYAAPALLRNALAVANSGRPGPVLVSIPLDVSTAMIERPGLVFEAPTTATFDENILRKVAGTLEHSQRPAIFVGSGARGGTAPLLVRELAERLQAPVMTTPKGKGVFPESHRLSLGVFGHGGHPSASKYLEGGIDVLLAIGTRLTDPATDGWSPLLRPTEHLIQIDTEAAHLGRNYPVSLGLVGTAEAALTQLLPHVAPGLRPVQHFGLERNSDPTIAASDRPISPARALFEIQRMMPPNTRYASDIGEHLLFATHYLQVDDPQGFLIMTGLASMGTGISGALGMKLAHPEIPVVAICGDGGFAMSVGDLATATREQVPLLVAVLNDGRYGMVELGHEAIYGRTPEYGCSELSIPDLARGVGADAEVITAPDQMQPKDIHSRLEKGPLVLDIRIDREVKMPKNKRVQQIGESAGRNVVEIVKS